jgi:hypothetical protein
MTHFFVRSIEHRTYHAKHGCVVSGVVDGNKLLIALAPPIPDFVYNEDADLEFIVLAPRYVGVTLTPTVSEWPCVVNLCVPKEGGDWEMGPWRLLDIGELTKE